VIDGSPGTHWPLPRKDGSPGNAQKKEDCKYISPGNPELCPEERRLLYVRDIVLCSMHFIAVTLIVSLLFVQFDCLFSAVPFTKL